ncbi:hypothetical protein NITHO_2680003 [Nitrolancea hollandica Lb]|uniref:Uncharacterized protein n=1 Tax=Nitrolancea hollandica Lb TaxID=1129897 RepID=I4EGB7_9BACT|nr:hypothetical protein NITHO_2680003 [Nitrolancea hollandica Lb]
MRYERNTATNCHGFVIVSPPFVVVLTPPSVILGITGIQDSGPIEPVTVYPGKGGRLINQTRASLLVVPFIVNMPAAFIVPRSQPPAELLRREGASAT